MYANVFSCLKHCLRLAFEYGIYKSSDITMYSKYFIHSKDKI